MVVAAAVVVATGVEVVTGAGIATGTAHHAGTAAVGADRHVVVVSAATAAAGHQHTGAAAGVAAGAGHHRAGTAHLVTPLWMSVVAHHLAAQPVMMMSMTDDRHLLGMTTEQSVVLLYCSSWVVHWVLQPGATCGNGLIDIKGQQPVSQP